MNTGSGNSLIDVALSGIVVASEQVGKVKSMLALAPRLEAADALAEAARTVDAHLQELEDAWLKGSIDERDGKGGTRSNRNVDCERMLHSALAAYDAAKKGEANGHR